MGMFDRLKFSLNHPDFDPAAANIEFQTKDLDCCLDDYEITKEGRLVKHRWDWEQTPENEKPYPNAEGIKALFGSLRKKAGSYRVIDLNFHGDINFYGDINSGEIRTINIETGVDTNHPGPTPEWFEYVARFTEGRLVRLTRILKEETA